MKKTCPDCGVEKDVSEFYVIRGRKALHSYCKPCSRDRANARHRAQKATPEGREHRKRVRDEWKAANAEHLRISRAAHATGNSFTAVSAVVEIGCCQICTSTEFLCVDHDHDTGELRGLLCRGCNSGLGFFADRADLLLKAAEYLESTSSREEVFA